MSLAWQVQENSITKANPWNAPAYAGVATWLARHESGLFSRDFETEDRGEMVLKDCLDHLQNVQYQTFNIISISGCLHC